MKKILIFFSVLSFGLSATVFAETFTLMSNDLAHGKFMDKRQEFNGFGCSGGDQSPHLKWSNAPVGTKSFAITVYDPDAPTGSGWWHWQVVNIPANVTEFSAGVGSPDKKLMPVGSMQILNDYGVRGFGGACPPKGHGKHRYRFTVYALSVAKLDLPKEASGALAGYMIHSNTIESATIESFYQRD